MRLFFQISYTYPPIGSAHSDLNACPHCQCDESLLYIGRMYLFGCCSAPAPSPHVLYGVQVGQELPRSLACSPVCAQGSDITSEPSLCMVTSMPVLVLCITLVSFFTLSPVCVKALLTKALCRYQDSRTPVILRQVLIYPQIE